MCVRACVRACVFWRWEKTKGGHEKHAVSQMHLNWRELGQVTNLLAFWDRTLRVCTHVHVTGCACGCMELCVHARVCTCDCVCMQVDHMHDGRCVNVVYTGVGWGTTGDREPWNLSPFLALNVLPKKLGQQNQPRPRIDSLQLLRTLEAGKER